MIDWHSLSYDEQLSAKLESLRKLLARHGCPEPEVHRSPEHGYRMRAEFRVWHQDDQSYFAMNRPGSREVVRVDEFPPAAMPIQQLMPKLLLAIQDSEILRKRLFSAEFLSTTGNEVLLSLIYHKSLDQSGDQNWTDAATELAAALKIHVIGRSRKQKIVLSQDYVTECLICDGIRYQMRQYENTFTQPNAVVNTAMVGWACRQAAAITSENPAQDLLELYCGNGNFTLPLARHYRKVLATEISKGSIAALKWNLQANTITNITVARMAATEVVDALDGVRPFRRLRDLSLDDYQFTSVFVDPPRAGIDQQTMEFLRRFDHIIYVSCNPQTLADNISQIDDTHQIKSAAAFDQFPFTAHLEAGVIMRRRTL